MKQINEQSKVIQKHLSKKAIIYIRQSSQRQMEQNTESQKLQYAMRGKAEAMGFAEIELIDEDLGFSASESAKRREGFERMLSSVALDEVGIIFSREASRLSRSNKDWCHLFEVCALFDTLIGDEESIYNPNNMDDQLVLGIKATMSVVELKILKMRMMAAREGKARRGELKYQTPPGYLWDEKEGVVKDPDMRIQEAIGMIFTKFREICSVRQTYLWFCDNRIELPVNKYWEGKKSIVWQLPTKSFVTHVLQNAFYAGVYIWGRRVTKKEYIDGRIVKKSHMVKDAEQSRVCLKNHHEGYIDWKSYEQNQVLIRGNSLNLTQDNETVGVAREGQGLLAGIIRCGKCGRKLHVRYWGKSGTAARYLCKGDFDGGGKYCLGFGGSLVDKRISKELLQVISPYGIEAGMRAAQMVASESDGQRKLLEQQTEQLEYETRRAFEQYNAVDPRNRLVAYELERRWNGSMEKLTIARERVAQLARERQEITEAEREKIVKLGGDFESVWTSDDCLPSVKKAIIRTVIREVIVNCIPESKELEFVIHWEGGCHTRFTMTKPVSGSEQRTAEEDIDIIRTMSVRYGDDEIARVLNKQGRRTGKGNRWSESGVSLVRKKHSIAGRKRRRENPDILSLGQAARYCNVGHKTIGKLVKKGMVSKQQIVPWAPWEIKRSDLDSPQVKKIIDYLHKTGKLLLDERDIDAQQSLFGINVQKKTEF